MKTQTYGIDGTKKGEVILPKFFSESVRTDLIQKIVQGKKQMQPYGPSLLAGNQTSASGNLKHHRKVWKSQYGRGMSRIPRKTMTRKGSQFNWVGAVSPNTRGGRRAHPPKSYANYNDLVFNKKELLLALKGALSASVDPKWVAKRYDTLKDEKLTNVTFIVENEFIKAKTKEILNALKKILGEKIFSLAIKKKTIRSGKGKYRGRKYKSNMGLLFVLGNEEKLKTNAFDVVSANKLGVLDLARGGPGRICVYTKNAIFDLDKKINGERKK